MKKLFLALSISLHINISAQTDAENIRKIYSNSLTNGKIYKWLLPIELEPNN
ncbi:hypothetical protein [Gelidibacter sp.]|uniref:hypothetical protein n=1 Tax=Gelidibacter sp. TaxID=2018083 RepID=UPI002BEAC8A3|nr:hypothetical protein [Gelidibacter sp.]HUH29595.1 hypothetical protein [Gelidibacter sp.]